MKLVDQVCSLGLAKKLKHLGIKQESLFYYGEVLTGRHAETKFNLYFNQIPSINIINEYSAFSVAELGEMLPSMFNGTPLQILKGQNLGDTQPIYCARYYEANLIAEPDINLANACAKMLIYLLENGLIEDIQTFIPENAASLILDAKNEKA